MIRKMRGTPEKEKHWERRKGEYMIEMKRE